MCQNLRLPRSWFRSVNVCVFLSKIMIVHKRTQVFKNSIANKEMDLYHAAVQRLLLGKSSHIRVFKLLQCLRNLSAIESSLCHNQTRRLCVTWKAEVETRLSQSNEKIVSLGRLKLKRDWKKSHIRVFQTTPVFEKSFCHRIVALSQSNEKIVCLSMMLRQIRGYKAFE
jgi:hypothetical protein